MSPPRVALIGPVPPSLGGATPGGVATHQAHLAEGLRQADGIEASLLATNVRSPSLEAALTPDPFYRMFLPGGITGGWIGPGYLEAVGWAPALVYAARSIGVRSLGSRRELLENLLWYRRYLWTVRPHVVHVQHPLERATYVRTVLSYEHRRVPLVITAHSFFGEHDEDVIHGLMAPNLQRADRVIAVSPHIADQAQRLGVPSERIRVIRSGVDVQRFQPRDRPAARTALDVPADQKLVLFVGNLEPRKGVDRLLRAIALVRKENPSVRLVIVGSGESAGADDQTVALQTLTSELGLTGAVLFAGRVTDAELRHWYAAADVFALPSSSEAQGIVALEAMASGLVVVATAVGGLLATIEDGETGFLVPADDPIALAQRISAVLADAHLRARIGASARLAVAREFSWQHAVARTIDVYHEVLDCAAR